MVALKALSEDGTFRTGNGGCPDRRDVDDLTKEFLLESGEGLDRMERCLADMRKGEHTSESIAEVFRAVHTIKGTVGFLGFPRLERLAHAGEQLLALVRDGKRALDATVLTWLVRLMDRLRTILQLIESTDTEGSRLMDHDAKLIAHLERLAKSQAEPVALEEDYEPELRESAADVVVSVDAVSESSATHAAVADTTLRVGVDTLNRLMNLVGELVQTRNQALQAEASQSEGGDELRRFGQRLESVTTDLRETLMQARMQPVEQLFLKFPRLVREVAQSCSKRVRLETSGGETGFDKSLIETLKDPLTHAVRNAIDHGIESPEERLRLGKPATGTLQLRAFHEGGHVVIEVVDDGAGIAREAVLRRAVARGLVSAERAAAMTDAEATELVFQAGFSTRENVTLISGRGVGMDVVRANVEQAGGTAELHSIEGQGTTLRLRVPLTLAIVPALVVRSGGMVFALPRSAVQEMVVVDRAQEAAVVQRIGNARMFRLRDRLIPLLELSQMLALPAETPNGYYIALLEAKGRQFGMIVDDILEAQEIVVKPLSKDLRRLGVYSGATLLGDGNVALILDAAGLARAAIVQERLDRTGPTTVPEKPQEFEQVRAEKMLLVTNHCGERAALPLAMVERIETVTRDKVEIIGGKPVLEHLGELVPLVDTGGLTVIGNEDDERLVVIYRSPDTGACTALVVREVLDIADAEPLFVAANGNVVRMSGQLTAVADYREAA